MSPEAASWEPGASLTTLRLRARMLDAAREFFAARDLLEVETPVLTGHAVSDPATHSLPAADKLWLRTSPEYHLKRLLAAQGSDVYEIGKVFRAGESGRMHQPEFTMIEWYRQGLTNADMATESCDLVDALLAAADTDPPPREACTYREAFLQTCGVDPLEATAAELAEQVSKMPGTERLAHSANRAALLDLLAGQVVYPALGHNKLCIVREFPADQAMLARLSPADPRVAERFELLFNGMELANGYSELSDAEEQAQRFATDNQLRTRAGLDEIEPDPRLLAALDAGLPQCAGVALGFDRVVLKALGAASLADVMSFTPGE